ncbi:hypothetical protein DRQ36_08295 [bacterium]|nr:MAG: hypothetical protein DRQ36_08295 [bacterium]
MPKKPFFSKFYMPGIMTILAFIISIPLAIVSNVLFDSTWPGFILFVLMAVAGEFWQYRRRKPYKEAGEILPSHPYAKVGIVFAVVGFVLLVISIVAVIEIEFGTPPSFHWDGWTWLALNGIIWDVSIFSILAVIFSVLTIYRALRLKKHTKWLAIYALIIALFTAWFGLTMIYPVIEGMNDGMIEAFRESQTELTK